MWQCLEEGRVNTGEDYLKVLRRKWLVPSLHHACTGYWGSPKPHLGRSKERGGLLKLPPLTSLALSPGGGEMMAGKPPPSPACELLPEVFPHRLSDVWRYVSGMLAICCSRGPGKIVGWHLCGRRSCNGFSL